MPAFETLDPELRGVLGKRIRELGCGSRDRRSSPTCASSTKSSSAAACTSSVRSAISPTSGAVPTCSRCSAFRSIWPIRISGRLERAIDDLEDSREIMRYMRHEAGHVFNYAYRLYARPDWRAALRPVRSAVSRQVPAGAVQPQLRAPHGRLVRAEASRRRLRRNVCRVADSGQRVEAPIQRLAGDAQAPVRRSDGAHVRQSGADRADGRSRHHRRRHAADGRGVLPARREGARPARSISRWTRTCRRFFSRASRARVGLRRPSSRSTAAS